ncbi:MAG: MBL fold metallo-hydrolase [Promethearchaeota archaeon]
MTSLKIAKHGGGLSLEYGHVKLGLDTGLNRETTLLSHSHADHLSGIQRAYRVISTEGTIETLYARGYKINAKTELIDIGESIGQLGVKITALNAGHVLGSTMFFLEFDDDLTVLYTGDFNAVDSLVHSAAKPVRADVLITEATYGTPSWVFPDRRAIYSEVLSKAEEVIQTGRIPVFQAYSLGKAQEAIALLHSGGFNVVSGNHKIDSVCKVYRKHGVDLRHLSLSSKGALEMLKEGCAIVCSSPRHMMKNMQNELGHSYARKIEPRLEHFSLSGWTLGETGKRGFPLSAHSDFPGLIDFAKKVNPRMAYAFTKNAMVFSTHLTEEGLNSVPLE